jgi:hypothetical protein
LEAASNEYISIQELEFATSLSGADVTTGGTAIEGAFRIGFPGSEAFDGDKTSTTHGWSFDRTADDMADAWVGYDFGEGNEVEIVEVRMWARNDAFMFHTPNSWVLEHSDDGTSWTTLWTITNDEPWFTSGETRTFTGTDDRTAADGDVSHWRLHISDSSDRGFTSISELEFRESASGADVTSTGDAIAGVARSGWPASEAFDNVIDAGNAWSITGDSDDNSLSWVGQDFSTDREIVEVAVTVRPGSFGVSHSPKCAHVQKSADSGVTWKTVWIIEDMEVDGVWTAGATKVFTKP